MKTVAVPFAARPVRRLPPLRPSRRQPPASLCGWSSERGAGRATAARFVVLALLATLGLACSGASAPATPRSPAAARQALVQAGLRAREVDGARGPLRVFAGGRRGGETVVLLHGTGRQAGDWQAVVPALARRYALLVLDLPGHGESAPASGALPVADLAAAVGTVLDAERPGERVTLIGNSLGGWVALLYAAGHPERVARVIGVDSSGIYAPAQVPLLPKTRDEARRLAAAIRGPRIPLPSDEELDAVVRAAAEGPAPRVFAGLRAEDFLDTRAAGIHVPVDLVWGADDGVLPLAYGQRLAALLPDARLHVLPGCGHMPQVFCPADLAAELERLLAQSPRVSR